MNKKGMEMFTVLGFVLGFLLLIALVVSFVEPIKNTNKGLIDKIKTLIPGLDSETELSSDFDEERIYEGTSVKVEPLPYNTNIPMFIVKQESGKGWNFEYTDLTAAGPLEGEVYEKVVVIVSHTSLSNILSSKELNGIISVNGRTFIHFIVETKDEKGNVQYESYWFEDKDGDFEYLVWDEYLDTNNNNCWDEGEPFTDIGEPNNQYDSETICLEEVKNAILADLVEKLT